MSAVVFVLSPFTFHPPQQTRQERTIHGLSGLSGGWGKEEEVLEDVRQQKNQKTGSAPPCLIFTFRNNVPKVPQKILVFNRHDVLSLINFLRGVIG
jgi:hypothetical protein